MQRVRIRELGITIGEFETGEQNAITDVPGVLVGHTTLISGEGPLAPGEGPVRTGVTLVLPHAGNLFLQKVPAAVHTINGFGKVCGFEQVRELGALEAPIALTNTLNVGLVLDALIGEMIRQNPELGITEGTVNVVVGETNDGYLNDLQGRHVRREHVVQALRRATGGPVEEGNVGAGTGTICLGWKGGIGASSRVLPAQSGGFTLGALVQTNFGGAHSLVISGVPLGRLLAHPDEAQPQRKDHGSVMVILATDAPLDSRQLRRLCVRAEAGLARTGGWYDHGSGDFVIAFSTANRIEHRAAALLTQRTALADERSVMHSLFQAVVESVEEAVLNSLSMADTLAGRDGHIAYGLPLDETRKWLQRGYPV